MLVISTNEISVELHLLINRISQDFNLKEWKIIFWNIKGENECIIDLKIIYLDKYNEQNDIMKWLLHEVTHILVPDDKEHGKIFNENYNNLLLKYLGNKMV